MHRAVPVTSSTHIRSPFNLFAEEQIRRVPTDHLMIGGGGQSDTGVVLREVKAEWQRPFRMTAPTSLGLL